MNRTNNNWIQTYSGRQFWPLNPDIEEIDIVDIAHALSNICRFTGHCERFYSVAEHCSIISDYLPSSCHFAGLLHDASEAYLCDIAKPIKNTLPDYQPYENQLQFMIYRKYGVVMNYESERKIKEFDTIMLQTEKEQLMKTEPADWELMVESFNHKIQCWIPERAEFEFLKRFKELDETT